MTTPEEPQRRVGFFRGLLAVARGTLHGVAVMATLASRLLARLTRKGRPDTDEEISPSADDRVSEGV